MDAAMFATATKSTRAKAKRPGVAGLTCRVGSPGCSLPWRSRLPRREADGSELKGEARKPAPEAPSGGSLEAGRSGWIHPGRVPPCKSRVADPKHE